MNSNKIEIQHTENMTHTFDESVYRYITAWGILLDAFVGLLSFGILRGNFGYVSIVKLIRYRVRIANQQEGKRQ